MVDYTYLEYEKAKKTKCKKRNFATGTWWPPYILMHGWNERGKGGATETYIVDLRKRGMRKLVYVADLRVNNDASYSAIHLLRTLM